MIRSRNVSGQQAQVTSTASTASIVATASKTASTAASITSGRESERVMNIIEITFYLHIVSMKLIVLIDKFKLCLFSLRLAISE